MESVKPFNEDYAQCRCKASNTSLKILSNADGNCEALSVKESGKVERPAREEAAHGKRRIYSVKKLRIEIEEAFCEGLVHAKREKERGLAVASFNCSAKSIYTSYFSYVWLPFASDLTITTSCTTYMTFVLCDPPTISNKPRMFRHLSSEYPAPTSR
jgi:hypothetical protein